MYYKKTGDQLGFHQKPVQNPNEKKKSRTAQVPSQNNICFVKKELENSHEQLRFLRKRLKCIIL
jgi:hypothetical protein